MEKIKENKLFFFYENIDEFLSELFPLIDQNKAIIKEESNYLVLSIKLPFQKINNIDFILKEKQKSDSEKINELFNIVNEQSKEMIKLKEENKAIKGDIKAIKEELKSLKERNQFILNKLNYYENDKIISKNITKNNLSYNIDSVIINNLSEIQYIINRLKDSDSLKNKDIFFNLLYRAKKHGDIEIFHQKCDNKSNQLVIIKTIEDVIFGGYTEIGFKSSGNDVIDNNAFVFSHSLKKIYNVKKNKYAIYSLRSYGPSFRSEPSFMIFIYQKIFNNNGNTCPIKDSNYDGITRDYEIKREYYIK